MKLNGETFKERPLTNEEAKELLISPVQSPTKTCQSVVINHHPENQTTFQNKQTNQINLPVVPGKRTYRKFCLSICDYSKNKISSQNSNPKRQYCMRNKDL